MIHNERGDNNMSDLGNKEIMANNIKYYMKIYNKTRIEICNDLDISYTTFADWINAKTYPRIDKIEMLANYFHIEKSDLVEQRDKSNSSEYMYSSAGVDFIRVPLYDNLCCGNGGFVEDNIIEFVPVPSKGLSNSAEYFCQIASGDSMIDAGIADGDLLIFEKSSNISNGAIGCFCVDENMATCKKYKEQNGIIILQPMNSKFEPIMIDPLNECFRCVGILKKSVKSFGE